MKYEVVADLPANLDAFTRGYLECAEWVGIVDDDEKTRLREAYNVRWHRSAIKQAREDCAAFQEQFSELRNAQAGHDFYLTRNRHGAGFWDGDYPEPLASQATDSAHAWGSADVEFRRGLLRWL